MRLNILLFWFMNDWGRFGRTYEMVARHLARSPKVGRVTCILPPGMIWNGYYALPFHVRLESRKLFVVTPNIRLLPKSLFPQKLRHHVNVELRDRLIARFLTTMGFSEENAVLWVFPPHGYINKLLNLVPRRILVTQVIDNHLHKTNERGDYLIFVKKQYEDLARISDLLFVSSRSNFEQFSEMTPKCRLFENALDENFLRLPSELPCRAGTRPRLGYLGWITQRTDLDLLSFVARERPQYDLHIVGPLENSVDLQKTGLLELPNVTVGKEIPYRDVPGFLETVDVCLIPHKDTEYSRAMSPLKLFQYLGSGRPIVSTRIAGIDRWVGSILIASTYEEFLRKIDDAIRNDTVEASRARIDTVRQETWTVRVDQMVKVIEEELYRKTDR
jgi:glycosyltransferase involved in cell wall biosynthesis